MVSELHGIRSVGKPIPVFTMHLWHVILTSQLNYHNIWFTAGARLGLTRLFR